ncbi:MAG TPA: A24 family peptidase [Nocardioidaceae bacterium]|nr:A24 family peptidase [Nocardioidaceae bacterium]
MTTDDLLVAAAMAVAAACLAWFAPRVIARLPDPAEVEIPYAELADSPRLAVRLALGSAVVAGSLGAALGPDPSLPMWCFLSVVGVVLSYVDWRVRLLPFRIVAPSYAIVGALLVVAVLVTGDYNAAVRSLIAWIATYAVFTAMWFVYRKGIGYGDVRLSGVLAMGLGWLGWSQLIVGMYAAFLLGAFIGGGLALVKIVDRKGYPFGPFMFAGAWVGVVCTPTITSWLT